MTFNPQPKPIPRKQKGEKKCPECGNYFLPKTGMQKYCMQREGCISVFIGKARDQKAKQEKKAWNASKKEMKEKTKTLADWKNDLQDIVNWIARELDKDLPCISHPDLKDFIRYDAGHFFGVKAHSDLRFNLHNIHKQNSQSNQLYGGNGDYARGLKERYGADYLDMVLSLPLRWSGTGKQKFKVTQIRDEYLPNARMVQREMKKGAEFTRDQINEMIGIYL